MADKSSIFKVKIDVSNIDQHRYEQLCFTVALDRKETINHMVMRLLAYAMVPEPNMAFGKAAQGNGEPDIIVKDYDEHIIYWIDAGFPQMNRVKKATRQSDCVLIFSVADSNWLDDYRHELMHMKNVHLILVQPELVERLSHDIERSIDWSIVIDENKLAITDNTHYMESNITRMHSNAAMEMATI